MNNMFEEMRKFTQGFPYIPEGPEPLLLCETCGRLLPQISYLNHESYCRLQKEKKRMYTGWYTYKEMQPKPGQIIFVTGYGRPIHGVTVMQHLGGHLSEDSLWLPCDLPEIPGRQEGNEILDHAKKKLTEGHLHLSMGSIIEYLEAKERDE